MKPVRIHLTVQKQVEKLDIDTRFEIATLLNLLALGESLGMPVSRPMPNIAHGAHELRVKDKSGQMRVFYFTKQKEALLVFHMFRKKTRTTPKMEIANAKRRLREML